MQIDFTQVQKRTCYPNVRGGTKQRWHVKITNIGRMYHFLTAFVLADVSCCLDNEKRLYTIDSSWRHLRHKDNWRVGTRSRFFGRQMSHHGTMNGGNLYTAVGSSRWRAASWRMNAGDCRRLPMFCGTSNSPAGRGSHWHCVGTDEIMHVTLAVLTHERLTY